MKRTKKFNQEWADAIALLPSNLQQSLTDAIRSYQNDGIEPENLHPIAQALFIVIKPTIDARARRSAYQKERRRKLASAPASVSVTEKSHVPGKEQPRTSVEEQPRIPVNTPLAMSELSEQLPPVIEQKPSSTGIPPTSRIGVPAPVKRNSNRFLRQVERARINSRH